jgi:hypothetical protein
MINKYGKVLPLKKDIYEAQEDVDKHTGVDGIPVYSLAAG